MGSVNEFDPNVAADGSDDQSGPAAGGRRRLWRARNVVAALAALPVLALGGWPGGSSPAPQDPPQTVVTTAQVGDPVRVRIPRIKIDAKLQALRIDAATSELQPPDHGSAGWYKAGPEPGEPGRAVIAGHLDSTEGPDVFWPLKTAHKGDKIVIDTIGGAKLSFVVTSVELHRRDAFPTSRVYGGPRKKTELRLITCGGEYVKSKGGYQSNVIVFAVPAADAAKSAKAATTN